MPWGDTLRLSVILVMSPLKFSNINCDCWQPSFYATATKVVKRAMEHKQRSTINKSGLFSCP